ncbi:MAG: hypothetical protein AAFU85_02765 [Planctomycetota bacterium]
MKRKLNDLEIARMEYAAKHLSRTIQFAEYWLIRNPEDGEGWEVLGLAHLRLGELEDGIDAVERASLFRPLSTEANIALAISYGCMGKIALSKDLLMMAATSGRLDEKELMVVAAGLEAIEEPTLAMEACRQAGVLSPESAEVHYQMGYYASRCDYPSSVVEALIRHAIHLEPTNLHYRVGLASLLLRLDRKSEALRIVRPLIPTQLNQVSCQCCLKRIANLFFDCEEYEIAHRVAERLAELDASTPASVKGA